MSTKSNWCDPDKWFKDKLCTIPNKNIPKNEVNDVIILKNNYTIVVEENKCFDKIPYIECNNLLITTNSDCIGCSSTEQVFTSSNIQANNIEISGPIQVKNWEDDVYSNYIANSIILKNRASLESVVCDIDTDFIASGQNISIKNSTINTNNLYINISSDSETITECKIKAVSGSISQTANIAKSILDINTVTLNNFAEFGSSNTGIGNFFFNNNSILYGIVYGDVTFVDNSTNRGQIIGNAIFTEGSYNFGLVSGNCIFSNNSRNGGIVYGNTLFTNSINQGLVIGSTVIETISGAPSSFTSANYGNISGYAKFNKSINYGKLLEGSLFDNGSINYVTITGNNSIIFQNSINSGSIVDANNFTRETRGIPSGSIKRFNLIDYVFKEGCDVSFSSGSINYGDIVTNGTVSFSSGSINYGSLTTQSIKFNRSSSFSGLIVCKNITFENFSENKSNIAALVTTYIAESRVGWGDGVLDDTPYVLFRDFPYYPYVDYSQPVPEFPMPGPTIPILFDPDPDPDYYTIPHNIKLQWFRSNMDSFNCEFYSSINYGETPRASFYKAENLNNGLIAGQGFFYKSSSNYGSIFSGAFYDNSKNSNRSDIVNQASFFNKSINESFPYTDQEDKYSLTFAKFYDNSYNIGFVKDAMYYNESQNYGIGDQAYFYNKSRNGIYLIFNKDNELTGGYGAANPSLISAMFRDSSINCHYYKDATGRIINPDLDSATFLDNSINYGSGANFGSFDFYHSSLNEGYCINAIFKDTSINKKIIYSGIFYNKSFNDEKGSGYNLFFYDNSYNNGTIINSGVFFHSGTNEAKGYASNALFKDFSKNKSSFYNKNIKTFKDAQTGIRPNISFTNNSINNGNIIDSKISFSDNSVNLGLIKFGSMFIFNEDGIFIKKYNDDNTTIRLEHLSNEKSLYNDELTLISMFIGSNPINDPELNLSFPNINFNGQSINSGSVEGYHTYFNNSINYGSVNSFNIIPQNHISSYFDNSTNFGNIVNNTTFFTNSTNFGNILCQNFDSSINSGIMAPSLSFDNINFSGSINYGPCLMSSSFVFSENYGNIRGSGNFLGSLNYGFIRDNALFDHSINSGNIGNNAIFNNSDNHTTIRGSGSFYKSNNFGDIVGDIDMAEFSVCSGAQIGGNALFSKSKYIGKTIFGNAVFVNDSCRHPSGIIKGLITQDATTTECE